MLFHYKHSKAVVPLTILTFNDTLLPNSPFNWVYAPTLEQANVDTKTNLFGYIGRFYLTLNSGDIHYTDIYGYKEGLVFTGFNQEYNYTWTNSSFYSSILLSAEDTTSVSYPAVSNITMYYAYDSYTVSYPAIP